MLKPHYLPDMDRLSVLAATILLAYTLARSIDFPIADLSFSVSGIYIPLQIGIRTLVAFLLAGLTASGADWLLRDHPQLQSTNTMQHWLLPALTALVVGVPLFQLPMGWLWWAIFGIGGGLLMLVLLAEYITVDPEDIRYQPAAIALTAVAFGLFLILAIVLRSAGVRLYLLLPAISLAGGLVSLRTLRLRLPEGWKAQEALVAALIVSQVAAAFHYWPLSPVSFGLVVLGPAYALTSLVAGLSEGRPLRQSLVEPGLALLLITGAAFWMR